MAAGSSLRTACGGSPGSAGVAVGWAGGGAGASSGVAVFAGAEAVTGAGSANAVCPALSARSLSLRAVGVVAGFSALARRGAAAGSAAAGRAALAGAAGRDAAAGPRAGAEAAGGALAGLAAGVAALVTGGVGVGAGVGGGRVGGDAGLTGLMFAAWPGVAAAASGALAALASVMGGLASARGAVSALAAIAAGFAGAMAVGGGGATKLRRLGGRFCSCFGCTSGRDADFAAVAGSGLRVPGDFVVLPTAGDRTGRTGGAVRAGAGLAGAVFGVGAGMADRSRA